jgi:hypothetical protein
VAGEVHSTSVYAKRPSILMEPVCDNETGTPGADVVQSIAPSFNALWASDKEGWHRRRCRKAARQLK